MSGASWVLGGLPKALWAVGEAVSGASWAVLVAVLTRPGRQLGAKYNLKRPPKSYQNELPNGGLFQQPLEFSFSGFFVAFRCQRGAMLAPKMERELGSLSKTPICIRD